MTQEARGLPVGTAQHLPFFSSQSKLQTRPPLSSESWGGVGDHLLVPRPRHHGVMGIISQNRAGKAAERDNCGGGLAKCMEWGKRPASVRTQRTHKLQRHKGPARREQAIQCLPYQDPC